MLGPNILALVMDAPRGSCARIRSLKSLTLASDVAQFKDNIKILALLLKIKVTNRSVSSCIFWSVVPAHSCTYLLFLYFSFLCSVSSSTRWSWRNREKVFSMIHWQCGMPSRIRTTMLFGLSTLRPMPKARKDPSSIHRRPQTRGKAASSRIPYSIIAREQVSA